MTSQVGPTPRAVVTISVVTVMLNSLPIFMVGSLSVFIREDLGLDAGTLGLSVSATFATSSLLAMHSGRLGERIGAFWTLRISMLLLGLVTIALPTLGAITPAMFVVLMVALGVTMTSVQPAANVAIFTHVPPGQQGLSFGVKQTAPRLATLLAGVAVPTLGLTIGWRWAFVVAGLLSIAVAGTIPTGRWADRPRAQNGRFRRARGEGLLRGDLFILAVGLTFSGAAATATGIFLVDSVIATGIHPGTAGLLLAFGSAASIVARLVAGAAVDRGLVRPFPLMAGMILCGTLASMLFAFGTSLGVVVAATFVGFAGGWGWNGLIVYVVVRLHPGSPGEASGVTQAAISLGGVIGPGSFGLLMTTLSLRHAWLLMAVSSAIGALLIATVARRTTRAAQVAPTAMP